MPNDPQSTQRFLPVIVGHDYKHIMARAEIFRTPEEVVITITGTGQEGQYLAEFLEQAPIALSFIAIPTRNIREKREN